MHCVQNVAEKQSEHEIGQGRQIELLPGYVPVVHYRHLAETMSR